MNELPLSDELLAVERALAELPLHEPSAGLRVRVLASIREQKELAPFVSANARAWAFIVGLAAAIAVWANLSFSALNYGVSMAAPLPTAELDRQAEFLHELASDFSHDDIRRQIARMQAGLRSSPARISPTQPELAAR
jgi:cytochrome c-type biogenesis protein CcmH/NrfG